MTEGLQPGTTEQPVVAPVTVKIEGLGMTQAEYDKLMRELEIAQADPAQTEPRRPDGFHSMNQL